MRRTTPEPREILPDPRYNSTIVTTLIHHIMKRGKMSLATTLVYDALETAGQKTGRAPMDVLEQALKNVGPMMEVRPRRVGGATYQVPVEVGPERAEALAIRWIIQYARAKKGMPMIERLAREFGDAYKGEGSSMKKREDTHKMAEANRAFAHYRW